MNSLANRRILRRCSLAVASGTLAWLAPAVVATAASPAPQVRAAAASSVKLSISLAGGKTVGHQRVYSPGVAIHWTATISPAQSKTITFTVGKRVHGKWIVLGMAAKPVKAGKALLTLTGGNPGYSYRVKASAGGKTTAWSYAEVSK